MYLNKEKGELNMTLLEYLQSIDKEGKVIYTDGVSEGVYIVLGNLYNSDLRDEIIAIISPILSDYIDCPFYCPPDNGKDDVRYIDGQAFNFLNNTNIVIDEEVSRYDTNTRRPYFQLRGKKVTEDQAFDIIRKTDRFFQWEAKIPEVIQTLHFPNWWFCKNHYPTHYGWCHPSGMYLHRELC